MNLMHKVKIINRCEFCKEAVKFDNKRWIHTRTKRDYSDEPVRHLAMSEAL